MQMRTRTKLITESCFLEFFIFTYAYTFLVFVAAMLTVSALPILSEGYA